MVDNAQFWHTSAVPVLIDDSPAPEATSASHSSPVPRAHELAHSAVSAPARVTRATEIGGPSGPEPTRYGDWEKFGRCIDF